MPNLEPLSNKEKCGKEDDSEASSLSFPFDEGHVANTVVAAVTNVDGTEDLARVLASISGTLKEGEELEETTNFFAGWTVWRRDPVETSCWMPTSSFETKDTKHIWGDDSNIYFYFK